VCWSYPNGGTITLQGTLPLIKVQDLKDRRRKPFAGHQWQERGPDFLAVKVLATIALRPGFFTKHPL
jgi:hypothetical protein